MVKTGTTWEMQHLTLEEQRQRLKRKENARKRVRPVELSSPPPSMETCLDHLEIVDFEFQPTPGWSADNFCTIIQDT